MPELKQHERKIRGIKCKKCGADSWVPNGIKYWRCGLCLVQQRKNRYERNKDEILRKNKKWFIANPDKRKEHLKRDANKNKKRNKQAKINWIKNNPGKTAEYCANRRAIKNKVTPLWANRKEIQFIYKLAREQDLVVDHIVPLISKRVCGLHCEDNLRCITAKLNEYKGNRYWSDM